MHVSTILFWLCGYFYFQVNSYKFPVVEIENGFVSGILTKTWKGRTIFTFEGIPYAAPPIGEFRFQVKFVNIQNKLLF